MAQKRGLVSKNTGKTLLEIEEQFPAHWTPDEVKAIRRKRGTIEVREVDPWGFKRISSPFGDFMVSIGPTDLDVVTLPACVEIDRPRHMSVDDYYRIFWPRTWFLKNLD